MERALTPGEHNLIANALFLRQETLRREAHSYRQTALNLASRLGDEDSEVAKGSEYADRLEAEALAVFNLELCMRRYTFVMLSLIAIPEQA